MKITALIENHSFRPELMAQYGLSLFVETAGGNILVDAGQDDLAWQNFCALGFSASQINAILLSHNHFDHVGGLPSFRSATEETGISIFVSAEADKPLYTKRFLCRKRKVSCNDLLEESAARIVWVADQEQILENVYACRIKAPASEWVCKDKKLKMTDGARGLLPDLFRHEIYLAVIEDGAVKIVSSCSHNGILNIVRDAEERFSLPVTVFVGGLHMRGNSSEKLNAPRAYFQKLLEELRTLHLKELRTCHCTGVAGLALLKKALSCHVSGFHTGDSFTV